VRQGLSAKTMTTVRIPRPMQVFTCNKEVVSGQGKNVRALIDNLDQTYPGLKDALVKDGTLKPGIAVMLDGHISPLGILQPLSEKNELVFIPALSGG